MSVWAYTRPEGFQDVLPPSAHLRMRVETTILDLCRSRGFDPIMVPVLEYADLYDRRRIGEDLYHQLLVTRIAEPRRFPPHQQEPASTAPLEATHEVVLRPDLTAPVARAFVTMSLEQGVPPRLPVRYCYAGDVFRNVAPRFGDQKAFRQVGVEAIGAGGVSADLDVLLLACDVADRLEIPDWTLSLGHAGLAPALADALGITQPRAREAVVAGLRRYHRHAQRLRASGPALREEIQRFEFEVFGMSSGLEPAPGQVPGIEDTGDPTQRLEALAGRLRRLWSRTYGLDETLTGRVIALAQMDPHPETFLQAVARSVPVDTRLQSLLDEIAERIHRLQALRPVRVEISPVCGRPIGYYTGITFELHGRSPSGAWTRFGGGGRYDDLYRWIHSRALVLGNALGTAASSPIPSEALQGIGFAFGLDRVLEVSRMDVGTEPEVHVSALAPDYDLMALEVADGLRREVTLRVVWLPASPGTPEPADAPALMDLVVACRDGTRVEVTDRRTFRRWTGPRDQVTAAISAEVGRTFLEPASNTSRS